MLKDGEVLHRGGFCEFQRRTEKRTEEEFLQGIYCSETHEMIVEVCIHRKDISVEVVRDTRHGTLISSSDIMKRSFECSLGVIQKC